MIYYRVKPEYDNRQRWVYVGHSNVKIKPDGILIAHELYTPRERERIANHEKYFEKVEISRRKIYWFFGARFSNETGVPVE
jgi:hypothetical protein